MTFSFPNGSSVYLIFAAIDAFTLSPVTGAKYSNDLLTVGKAHGQHGTSDLAEAVKKIPSPHGREGISLALLFDQFSPNTNM
jgi:hypothetical protein